MSSKRGSVAQNMHVTRTNADIFRLLTVALRERAGDNFSDVTILRTETANDFSECRVYINPVTDGEFLALERATGFLRNEIAQNIRLKHTPRVRFIIDRGVENAKRVEELLAQLKK